MPAKLFVLFALAISARADILGFEDWQHPLSDRDFNDAEYVTTGLSFHTHEAFSFAPLPGYSESPFPAPARYFDYAVALHVFRILYSGGQTSGHDVLEVSLDGGEWLSVGSGLTLSASPGQRVDFRLESNGVSLYADPARNIDGLGYGVVYHPPAPPPMDGQVPEPGSLLLAATGCAMAALARWRRR